MTALQESDSGGSSWGAPTLKTSPVQDPQQPPMMMLCTQLFEIIPVQAFSASLSSLSFSKQHNSTCTQGQIQQQKTSINTPRPHTPRAETCCMLRTAVIPRDQRFLHHIITGDEKWIFLIYHTPTLVPTGSIQAIWQMWFFSKAGFKKGDALPLVELQGLSSRLCGKE